MAEFITFFCGAAIILAGAIGVVVARNAVHSALFLIQTLLGVAVIFVVQEAHFLAAVQIVVYAGAIVILAELALTPPYYLVLSALMFAVGATGLLIRRNPLVMFMCVELMLNGVNISFVAFGADLNDVGGQISVFFVLVVAAVEVVVGLALVVAINRRRADATADDVSLLRG